MEEVECVLFLSVSLLLKERKKIFASMKGSLKLRGNAIQETVKEHSVLSLNFYVPVSTCIFILSLVF